MAIFTVFESTTGSDSGSSFADGRITLTATRSWNIASNTPGDSSRSVQASLQNGGSLPNEGNQHPDHFLMTCRTVNVTRVSPIFYTATASYESIAFDKEDEEEEDPWDVSAKVSWKSASSEAETDEDVNGKSIVNTGTDEPVTGITRRISDVVAVIKKPFIVFSGPTIRNFMDKTNSDTYLGFAAGEGMVQSISAEPAKHEAQLYYEVTAEVMFRTPYRTTSDKAWRHRRIIKGFYELLNGHIIRAVDDEKADVTTPVNLDAAGARLAAGANPETEETKLYDSIAFSGMGFF